MRSRNFVTSFQQKLLFRKKEKKYRKKVNSICLDFTEDQKERKKEKSLEKSLIKWDMRTNLLVRTKNFLSFFKHHIFNLYSNSNSVKYIQCIDNVL